MLANRDVEAIKLNTKLGSCNLRIKAQLRNDDKAMQSLGNTAMQYLTWHSLGSAAFNSKSDFKREDAYSDALAKHLVSEAKSILGKVFEGIEIETSEYVKPVKKVLTADEIISGIDKMSDADKAKMIAKLQQKSETKVEAIEED